MTVIQQTILQILADSDRPMTRDEIFDELHARDVMTPENIRDQEEYLARRNAS